MDSQRAANKTVTILWFMFWAVASSAWCLSAAPHLSATFDEPFYVTNGLHAWRTGSYKLLLKAGTMPLPVDVETLPLYVWEQFRDKPFDAAAELEVLLRVSRAANLLFWWLLLFYGFRLGRLYGGAWGGRVAVMMLACEPNLLAHATLATADIAVTACIAAFVYHYQTGRDGNWRQRIGIPALWYGIAVLSKASALAFAPAAMFALEHFRQLSIARSRCRPDASLRERIRKYWDDFALFPAGFWKIVGLGLLLTFCYCGSDWQQERSFVVWAEKLPDGLLRNGMTCFAENLRIFANAGSGLVYQIKHNIRGHGAYLFGSWYSQAVPYYFPAVLLIKLTVPVLSLYFLMLLLRPRAFATPLGLLVLVLIAFSVTCRVQIGIRLILPLVGFLMIALAAALARSLPEKVSVRSFGFAGIALIFMLALPPWNAWPDGIRYTNDAFGGTMNGYRHLSDSNYDWGQGLKELSEWQHRNGEPPMKVWYYGKDSNFCRSRQNCPLHSMPIESATDFLAIVRGNYLAVSTSILYRDPDFTPASIVVFSVLNNMKPVARTSTFFIFDFGARSP
jgi:hypothetical protein